jgi:hypothetical protein
LSLNSQHPPPHAPCSVLSLKKLKHTSGKTIVCNQLFVTKIIVCMTKMCCLHTSFEKIMVTNDKFSCKQLVANDSFFISDNNFISKFNLYHTTHVKTCIDTNIISLLKHTYKTLNPILAIINRNHYTTFKFWP